jgi:hypothetical protein
MKFGKTFTVSLSKKIIYTFVEFARVDRSFPSLIRI